MANYREEWVRFTQCFHDFDSLVLTVGAAEPEKIVLILIDNPEDEDLDAGRVMAPARMNTFKAVLGRALFELQKDKVKLNVRFVLSAVVNSQDSLNYGKTLTTLISRVRPDTVIGMGMRVNKTLVTDGKYLTYFGRPYPAHVTKEKKTKDVKIKFDLIPSVPTWGWTDPKPAIKDENGGGMVNMIGQVIKHFKTAVTGQCEGTIYVKDNNPPFTFIDTIKKFDKFLKQLKKTRIICMDTEGTGLGVITSEIISVQFCLELRDKKGKQIMDKESLYFLPLNHYQTPWTATEIQYIKDKLQHFFEKGKTKYIIFQNGKYDVLQFYSNLGVRWFNHRLYDTQAGEFTLDENWKFSSGLGYRAYALESIENRYGYYRTDLAISKADRSNMAAKPLMDIANYGMIDVVTPFLIHEEQLRIAEKRGYNKFLLVVADQIGNMILVFSIMEHNGMPVDIAYLQTLQSEDSKLNQTVNNMLESFKESKAANRVNDRLLGDRNYQEDGMFGKVEKPWLFDINTQDHAQKLFIEELKLKPIHTGANGKASLDDKFQSKYKDVPEVAVMSQYSKAKKIKTGFSEALYSRLLTDPDAVKDGHIRSVYKYLQVVTGRSSCFVGDTPVYTPGPEGSKPIKDVKVGDLVWSFNQKTLLPELKPVTASWCVGRRDTVTVSYRVRRAHKKWEVKTLECTPDHKFMLVDGSWCEAQHLAEGSRIQALERSYHNGYRELRFTNQNLLTGVPSIPEHRAALLGVKLKKKHKGLEVHHVNEIRDDNNPSNLQLLTREEHGAYHWKQKESLLSVSGEDHHSYINLSKKKIERSLTKHQGDAYAVADDLGCHATTLYSKCRALGVSPKLYMPDTKNPSREYILSEFERCEFNATKTCTENGWDYQSFKNRCVKYGIDFGELVAKKVRKKLPDLTHKQLSDIGARIDSGEPISSIYYGMGIDVRTFNRLFFLNGNHAVRRDGRYTKKMVELSQSMPTVGHIQSYLGVTKEKAQKIIEKGNNHQVLSVTTARKNVKVYDITVADNHTFVANGCSVHNSTNPNLQNQPERGEFAKLIKRIFCVPKGEIVIKADFSAHEVRGFGNIALDSKIGQAFESARKAIFRVRLAKKKDLPEAKAKMATEGDIHIQNVRLFFNQIVDKAHHLRYAIKAVVFGVLYGKQAKALSNDINNDKSETVRLRMEMKVIKKLLKR